MHINLFIINPLIAWNNFFDFTKKKRHNRINIKIKIIIIITGCLQYGG